MVCFDDAGYTGFLVWTQIPRRTRTKCRVVLNQIFVRKEFRGRGLGTALVREWVKRFVPNRVEKFGVESPNASTRAILIRLGHAYRKDDKVICSNCYPVPSI